LICRDIDPPAWKRGAKVTKNASEKEAPNVKPNTEMAFGLKKNLAANYFLGKCAMTSTSTRAAGISSLVTCIQEAAG